MAYFVINKLLWYARKKAFWDMLFLGNNHLRCGNSTSASLLTIFL